MVKYSWEHFKIKWRATENKIQANSIKYTLSNQEATSKAEKCDANAEVPKNAIYQAATWGWLLKTVDLCVPPYWNAQLHSSNKQNKNLGEKHFESHWGLKLCIIKGMSILSDSYLPAA